MTASDQSRSPSGLTLAAFVGAVILGGANFLFVRVSMSVEVSKGCAIDAAAVEILA